jgi:hypothetical protein
MRTSPVDGLYLQKAHLISSTSGKERWARGGVYGVPPYTPPEITLTLGHDHHVVPTAQVTWLPSGLAQRLYEIKLGRDVADRVVFVDGRRILEEGPPNAMLSWPRHPRTRAFLEAAR